MIYAYKFGDLSVIQPMMSSNYIYSLLMGVLILGEPISLIKIISIFIIMAGLFLIGGSDS